MDCFFNWLYLLFCKVGLHQDVYREGWIDLENGVSKKHNGVRCVWCAYDGSLVEDVAAWFKRKLKDQS